MHSLHPDFKKAQTKVDFMLGPIKIKDGLFTGDQFAAKDIQFIITNKVTHIINTVSKAIPNLYERFGVQYLSVHWSEKEQNIFDRKNNAINAIFTFVEEAMQLGQCCLIHSVHGKSRACAVLFAYLLKKYNWSLNKALDFIRSKKEGLQIRSNFLIQMQQLEKRMLQSTKLSNSWKENNNEEQILLANTFRNAKKQQNFHSVLKKSNNRRVGWDEKLVQRPQNNNLSSTMTRFQQQQLPGQKKQTATPKSILKGFPNEQQRDSIPQKEYRTQQKVINSINANIVHVTVNNFITTQKKAENTELKSFNTRPFSSDTKQRQKKNNILDSKNSKFYTNDFTSNIKNVYEQKIMSKLTVPSSAVNKITKKKEQLKVIYGNERPQSAKGKPNPAALNFGVGRQQMMITGLSGSNGLNSGANGAKRKILGSVPKQQPFRPK